MRILFVIPHWTMFAPQGCRERVDGVLELLSEHEIHFLIPSATPEADLRGLPQDRLHAFDELSLGRLRVPYFTDYSRTYTVAIDSVVRQKAIDAVVFSFPWGLSAFAQRSRVPAIYLSHGVERDFAEITLKHIGANYQPIRVLFRQFVSRVERRACRLASLILTMSAKDSDSLVKAYGLDSSKLVAVPQPVRLPSGIRPDPEMRSRMRSALGIRSEQQVAIFHGSYSHLPNRQAIDLLRDKVAPLLHRTLPNVTIVVAGAGVTASTSENFIALRFQEKLDEFLSIADIAIVPILEGCGVRMKLFDYFRLGIPVVATEKAYEGLPLVHGREVFQVGTRAEEIESGISRVLNDATMADGIREEAFRYLKAFHDPSSLGLALNERLSASVWPHLQSERTESSTRAANASR